MQKHKYLAIAISIVVGGLWIALVMYTMSLGKTKIPVNPGVAAVSSVHRSSGVNRPTASFKTSNSSSWSLIHHDAAITPAAATKPQATMGSTSMRIHETSSATVHQIGGGGMGSGQGVMATTSGSQRGISYAGLGVGGNMLALAATTPLAKPGAGNAAEIASTTTSERNAAPDIRKVSGNPHGPFPDPVGDVAWILIAILALAYAYIIYRKRARA